MDWKIRVAKMSVQGRLPFGQTLRRTKRWLIGYEPDPRNLRDTLVSLERLQNAVTGRSRSFEGATILEIGSGWFPTIPIMLGISGARHVYMSDLNAHMDTVTFDSTLRFLREALPGNARLNEMRKFSDLPLTYLAPFHASKLAEKSIDYVISRTVLEHIPPTELVNLLRSLRPKMSVNGLMVHIVDHSDHLEHTDKSISKINFLTWSERKHSLINTLTKEGENRLRHHEYPSLFERAGFATVDSDYKVHEETLRVAPTLALVEPYSAMTPEQLSILESLYVLAPTCCTGE